MKRTYQRTPKEKRDEIVSVFLSGDNGDIEDPENENQNGNGGTNTNQPSNGGGGNTGGGGGNHEPIGD